jgi:2-dehydro-3-deoxygalactonokinase
VVSGAFLAIDWGTTNRRIYRIVDGHVIDTVRDDRGVTSIAAGGYPAEISKIRTMHGDLPIIMAGMVGSNIGWRMAPYIAVPAGLHDLAANLLWIDDRTAIVPGLSLLNDHRADVMRGEEVQLLGAVSAELVPDSSLLCQPGTHCKWAEISDAKITDFITAMTGELFFLLRNHGLLAAQLGEDVTISAAFEEGVDAGARGDLATSLFGIRASKLLGRRGDRDASSYASGLLIGADVAARLAETEHPMVYVLADAALGGLYVAAIKRRGHSARLIDSHDAFVAGSAT